MDFAVKPNIDELWTSYCNRLLACPCTDEEGVPVPRELRLERLGHEKQLFFDAAEDAIRILRERLPLKMPLWGDNTFVQINSMGVPTERSGRGHVSIISSEDYRESEGFNETLHWYAARGIYPINRVVPKMMKSIPENLEWKELSQVPVDLSAAMLSLRDHELNLTLGDGIEFAISWPRLTACSDGIENDFLQNTCQWSFHSDTQTLWLRSRVYSFFFHTDEPVTLQLDPQSKFVIAEFIRPRANQLPRLGSQELKEVVLDAALQAEKDGSHYHCQRFKDFAARLAQRSQPDA